jgi:hypothetical protein
MRAATNGTPFYTMFLSMVFFFGVFCVVGLWAYFHWSNGEKNGSSSLSSQQIVILAVFASLVLISTVLLGLGLFYFPSRTATTFPANVFVGRATLSRPDFGADWKAWINYYRIAGGSTPVQEDATLTRFEMFFFFFFFFLIL